MSQSSAVKADNSSLFLKGFKEGFSKVGLGVSNIVNFFLLLLVYLVGIGVPAIIAKLMRKRFLDLKIEKEASHWHEPEDYEDSMEDCYRQF